MLIYLILRLFTSKREFIEGDELRYMACAKNFYKLWNKSLYDTHPPLYSWLLKRFRDFGYYRAGVIVSLLCSITLYLVCSKLYTFLGLNPAQKSIALLFLTFNYTLIYYSNKAFRYQLIALLGTMTLYFTLTSNFIASGLSWGLLSLTCVFAGLRGVWIVLTNINIMSFILYSLIFGSWLLTKYRVYKKAPFYPAGIDGKIEPTTNLTFKQLISPLYFPWVHAYYGKLELGYNFKNWHKKIGGVFGLYLLKDKRINALIYLFTGLLTYFTIRGMMQSDIKLVILTLILLYPSLLKRFLPRNSIMAIPLLCYFIGLGVWQVPLQWGVWASIGSTIAYLWFNRVFCLSRPKIKARVTSAYLNDLPKDGVLAEGLIAYPIAYRTNKRVVVIPHDPDPYDAIDHTCQTIHEFDINYVVISDLYKTELHLGYPAIKFLQMCPLIKTIREDGDVYNVYEIPAI